MSAGYSLSHHITRWIVCVCPPTQRVFLFPLPRGHATALNNPERIDERKRSARVVVLVSCPVTVSEHGQEVCGPSQGPSGKMGCVLGQ